MKYDISLDHTTKSSNMNEKISQNYCDVISPFSKPPLLSMTRSLRPLNGSNGTNGSHHGSNGSNGNGALASASLLRSETASGNPVQVGPNYLLLSAQIGQARVPQKQNSQSVK